MSENVQTKDLTKVIEELEKKCEEMPDNVVAHHHLAVVYRMAGRTADALRMLERCLEIDPQAVQALVNIGSIHFENGDFDKAMAANEQALKIMPNSAEAHANLGMIWWQKGDGERSTTSYKEALRHDAKMVTAWAGLASAHIMTGKLTEALEAAQEGVKLEPDFPLGQNNLAVALFYNNDFPGAKTAAEKAKKLGFPVDPRFFEAINKEI
ncbi:MAG: tetratricopeptide repeat protein [Desulfobulbaceae bacterium]|nr:tetratricopeptide repeat protein [Desulfobulbaceae bacterium]